MKIKQKLIEENFQTKNISLDLSGCSLIGTEIELKQLKNFNWLRILRLNNNEITDLSFLESLTFLEEIDLNENKIEDISLISNLKNLKKISVKSNKISKISLKYELSELQVFNIADNKVDNLSFLLRLPKLHELDISDNVIKDYKLLVNLLELHELNLSYNQIIDISFVSKLVNLEKLILNNNQICDISPLKNLKSLKTLNLNDNKIFNISLTQINFLENLKSLYLKDNPIKNIPLELFNHDSENGCLYDIRNCLEAKQDDFSESENKEVKFFFMGDGYVGKTQIVLRICHKDSFVFDSQHESTKSIALLRTKLGGFNVSCWDFAGQDIYHSTHRLFTQTRSLLILVWDYQSELKGYHEVGGYRYENEKLSYWLEYAKYFAPDSPVLILQNKIDESPTDDILLEKKEEYKKEYPTIIDFLEISAKTGKGFKVLERVLKKIIKEHPTFETSPLPTKWVKIIQEDIYDRQEKNKQKTISISEFTDICVKKKCEKATKTILEYLHNIGILYHHKTNYFKNNIILDQDWIIQSIYKIFDRTKEYFEILEYEKGHLDYEIICEIWADNTDEERNLFIDFMLSAELAFETTKKSTSIFTKRTFIVPQLLAKQIPSNVVHLKKEKFSKAEKKEIEYQFLPKIFIQRFIIKTSSFSEPQLVWQKGILIKMEEGEAIVEAVYEGEKQKIIILATNKVVGEKIEEELNTISEGKFRSKKIQEGDENIPKFGGEGLKGLTYITMDTFIEHFKQSTITQIDSLLKSISTKKMSSEQLSNFNKLKNEFIDIPEGQNFSKWKEKTALFIRDCEFESEDLFQLTYNLETKIK